MAVTRKIPLLIKDKNLNCSGCGHAIVIRLLCEVVEEFNLINRVIYVRGVGCCSSSIRHTNFAHLQASHGRVGAVVTGVSRSLPDLLTVGIHGDGDAYDIGLSETFNLAYRNENVVEIVFNNNVFAMTGGQMSHTTMENAVTTTSPSGRNCLQTGFPIRFPEIVAASCNSAFVARGAVNSPAMVEKTKKYIRKAVQKQQNKEGHSLIEVLSQCPTNWHMTPIESLKMIDELKEYFPLGILREKGADK